MRGLLKCKGVSWASDVNLCQVRLFLSDESPSQVGLGTQDHLQAKSSLVYQASGVGDDDNLPPGFEGSHSSDLLTNNLSQIPLSKWICPPRFALDFTWQVVAGEESKEVELQNQREMSILEAVYPRPSAIPPNPSGLTDFEASPDNELNVPVIPVTPIEDEDTTIGDTSTYTMPQNAISAIAQSAHCTTANGNAPVGVIPGADPSMVAQAAYAVLNAVATSNSQVGMIDPELLMKILNDPNWQEKLIASHGAALDPVPMPNPSPPNVLRPELPHVETSRSGIAAPPLMSNPLNGTFYSSNRVGLSPPPPVTKDLSYYKSLIQQHGGEKSEGTAHLNEWQNPNQELVLVNNVKPKDLKSKKMKPCIYFNSPRGCRNGANCPYQHDASSSVPSAKRVKLDREITG